MKKSLIILSVSILIVVVLAVILMSQTETIANFVSKFNTQQTTLKDTPQSSTINKPATAFLTSETERISDLLDVTTLQNPFGGYLDSCFSNKPGAGNCGIGLNELSDTTLSFASFTDPEGRNYIQSPNNFSLYIARKGATWTAFQPEIAERNLTPQTAYFQFFSDLASVSANQKVDLGFFAAYYELLFSTLQQPDFPLKGSGIMPVPPSILINEYIALVAAYSANQSSFTLPVQERIRTLSWSPQAKAIVAVSSKYLHPTLVQRMFSQEGSMSQSYKALLSPIKQNQTYQLSLNNEAVPGEEFKGSFFRSKQANEAPQIAACKNELSYICSVDNQKYQIACQLAPYWTGFCLNRISVKPLDLTPAAQLPL